MAARMPMMRMTTRSSMSVKPCSSSRGLRSIAGPLPRVRMARRTRRGGPGGPPRVRRLVRLDYHQLPAESADDLQAPVACAVQVRVMTPVPVAFVMVKVLPLFDVAVTTYESAAADVMTTFEPSFASVIDAGPVLPVQVQFA